MAKENVIFAIAARHPFYLLSVFGKQFRKHWAK